MSWAGRVDEDWDRSDIAPPLPNVDVPPAPGRWTKPPPSESRIDRVQAWLGGLALSFVGMAILSRNPDFVFPLLILVLTGDTSDYIRKLLLDRPTRADLRLLEDPSDPDVCLVRIELFRQDESVGTDRGIAWFADSLLLFSGHRTSFALGGEDLVPRSQRPSRLRLGGELPLRVPSGTASVAFQPLRYGRPRSESRFWTRYGTFAFFTPRSRGPRQWPPLSP